MSLGYLVNTSTLRIILTPQLCDSGGYVGDYIKAFKHHTIKHPAVFLFLGTNHLNYKKS